jgi:demethylmenaquinone methyltransferase/2-methoxy-6-polyprenyl-1,4-benzoquinol methylase
VRDGLNAKRSAEISAMFGRISDRYDLLNRVLSVGLDRRWRRLLAQRVAEAGSRTVLDVCTGTGDLAMSLPSTCTTYGSDFCLPMLRHAQRKAGRRRCGLPLFAADALRLPVRDESVDLATVAFGVRNFENLAAGLRELARVLRPGGTLLILEFSKPRGPFAPMLQWWVRHVPTQIGRVVSRAPDAYGYLSSSVETFPDGEELCQKLKSAGVTPIRVDRLTGGVASLYESVKFDDREVEQ